MFAQAVAGKLRYCGDGWRSYNGRRWAPDPKGLVAQEHSKCFVLEIQRRAEAADLPEADRATLLKAARGLQRKTPIGNIVELAKSDPLIRDTEAWAEPPLTLNFLNGTIKLPSLDLLPHDPDDRLMRVLPYDYDPAAECPVFDRVLADALPGETADYLISLMGYALKGTGELQQMLILVGAGRNGKTTIVEAISHAFGDYATTANPSTFMKSNFKSSINNDIAALNGARLVTTSELNPGEVLDSALIKRATGGEQLKARHLYQEDVAFHFTALPVMVSNFMPNIDGSDFALTRRLNVVRFDTMIDAELVDMTLPAKLKKEAPGIMNRLIEGYRRFEAGLVMPAGVKSSTDMAIRAANQVQQFIEDYCIEEVGARVMAGELFHNYRVWANAGGLSPMSNLAFKGAMERTLNVESGRTSAGRFWPGITLKRISPM